jgi:hypothetical protein
MKVTHQYKTSKIINDLSYHKDLTLKDIKLFSPLSNNIKKAKKSFVLVISDIDYNAVPDTLTVVPSLLEAKDIIEMEEIERDLGFKRVDIYQKKK